MKGQIGFYFLYSTSKDYQKNENEDKRMKNSKATKKKWE